MATLAQIRSGLASNLSGLEALGYEVHPYLLANPSPPCVHVMPGEVQYDKAMRRGLDEVFMVVQAYVELSSDIDSQLKLDALIAPTGSGSVKTLVEADRTLGGVVDNLHVTGCSGYETAATAEGRGPFLLCEWTVRVFASN